jgi:hypothetical protein
MLVHVCGPTSRPVRSCAGGVRAATVESLRRLPPQHVCVHRAAVEKVATSDDDDDCRRAATQLLREIDAPGGVAPLS